MRRAVAGVDIVFHNVAQVPLARDRGAAAQRQRRRHRGAARRAPRRPASARSCTRRRARCSAIPDAQPGAADTRAAARSRPTAHAKLAAEWACLRAAADGSRRHDRAAAHHPRPRSPRHLRDPVRLDRRRRRPVRARRRLQPLPVRPRRRSRRGCASPRRRRPGPTSSTPAPTASARCARRSSNALRARRHRGPGPLAAGRARRRRRCAPTARLGLDAVRPVPLADVRRARCGSTSITRRDASRLDAALVERRDARRELRLVRRQPRAGDDRRQRPALASPSQHIVAPAQPAQETLREHRVSACGARPARVVAVGADGRARLRAGADVVARADARRHQAVPVPRPATAGVGLDLALRRPPVRRVGAAPDDRLPVAVRPVVRRRAGDRAARLGRPPAVDRHDHVRRRHRDRVGRAPPARLRARRGGHRRAGLPAVARTSCRTCRARRRCCCRGPGSAG